MLIFFTKSQFNLFDAPVHVAAHVRKDGALVDAHVRIQKVSVKRAPAPAHHATLDMFAEHNAPAPAVKRSKLDAFIARHGGLRLLGSTIAGLSEGQQQALFAEMAKLAGKTPAEVSAMFDAVAEKEPEKGETPDLFADKAPVQESKPSRAKFQPGDVVTFKDRVGKEITALVSEHRYDDLVTTSVLEVPPRTAFKVGATVRRMASDMTLKHRAPAKPEPVKPPKAEVKPAREVDESDQDRSHREWREHYDRIVNLSAADLVREGTKDLERASNYGAQKIAAEKRKGWDGGSVNTALINSMQVDVDAIDAELKRRRDKRDAKAGKIKTVSAEKVQTQPAKPAEVENKPAPVLVVPHDPTAPFGVPAGTSKKKRLAINSDVVKRLADGGPYSDADRALFRQYSGNGGCGDSLNEFYTDPEVARGMWTAIAALGVTGGTALEPSCATGVFLHTAPAGFKVTGVELDPTSAAAATALHGDRHEIHTASLERFATSDDRQFDVVIGNPPYGPRGFLAKDDKKDISTAEAYFTDTALDKCKPGGIVALVVPTGIMDSKTNRSLRERLLTKGEFLGAQRMPNTAFEHSHTEVTTDVIYLRKRPDDVAGALGTVDQATLQKLGVWDAEFISGEYFTGRGASNVLGTMTEGWRAKAGMGNDITVEGSMDGVADAIADFTPESESAPAISVTMHHILGALGDDQKAKDRALSAAFRRPYANIAKVGDTKVVDGVTYVLQGDPPRWHSVDEYMQTAAISDAEALGVEIEMAKRGVVRDGLADRVRAYVEKHGNPNDSVDVKTAANVNKIIFNLLGAVNRKGELSDLVTGTVRKTESGFDATAQALALQHNGDTFDAAELADRLGKTVDEVEDQLAADQRYAFAVGGWTTMDAYLTGDLWLRLDAAKKELETNAHPELADKLRLQIERLEKTIDPKSLDDVDIQVNSAFIPTHILSEFMTWKLHDGPDANDWTKKERAIDVKFDSGVYFITGGNSYSTEYKALNAYLNRGTKDAKMMKEYRPVIDALNVEFKDWLCASAHRDAIEEKYNRSFRGFVAPEYSNEPIEVPGLNPNKSVRDWRWSSLRRSLATGKGIIADDVGLGKTLGGLLLARMAKVQGTTKRPVIVAPKSVLANWYSETQDWFPGSKVLTIGANFAKDKDGMLVGVDDTADERKRKYHDMTQNDYDFVIISEPSFEEIDITPERKEQYYSEDFWVQRGDKLDNVGDKRRKAIKENFEQSVAQREFSERTNAVYFEDLGIDMLIADEMHHQKNLYSARARFGDQPKFLGGQGLSNRALDFNMKARWIRETNGGKNVHGLTATPTKNSPLEVYSMLSHIAPEAFERIGIRNSEEFLDRFCEFVPDKVLSTKGDIEDATVVAGFKNMDELREIMSRYIDRRTAAEVGLKLPSRDDRMHLVDMTRAQQDAYAELRELAEESSGKKDATGDSHIFSIMDKMHKAALDLSILDPVRYAGAESPKYKELAKQCLEGAKEGGQIVFSELIESHDKIVAALVDAGFKKSEIGIINADVAKSSVKRQNIADKLNAGIFKVVIGNCTMAEGLNMQKTTTDIHHMDVPWDPATLQQRNGRGLRQGNNKEAVRIHTYLSKGSFDGYRYQAVSAKKDWQDILWNGGDKVENLARQGKVSRDEMRIMLAADPEAARAEFEKDKDEATKRFDAGKREDAQAQYVRFTEISRTYKSMKNRDSVSGQRLRQKIEAAKTALFNNAYWPAKSALDSVTDVLIHPQSGTVLAANQGMEFPDEGKMVVTGVNMRAGTVTMRRHANIGGGRDVTVPVDKLSDAKPFKFDAETEASEVGAAMTAQAEAKLNSLTSWNEVKVMPSAVLEKNHDLIQRQIKDGAKSHKFSMPYGAIPMVDKATGEIKMAESYEHAKLHDTHDYLLPTDAAKEKAIQAWMDERRGAKIGIQNVSKGSGRGRGSRSGASVSSAAREYKGASYTEKHINPMRGLLRELSGVSTHGIDSPLEREAKSRLATEQVQRIRRAPSALDAINELLPLGSLHGSREGYGADSSFYAKYPKQALAMAWARARHLGQLDATIPMRHGGHNDYAWSHAHGKTIHSALIRMARNSGHDDLADAFAATGERHGLSKVHTDTLEAMTHGPEYHKPSSRALEQIGKLAERAGVMDDTIGQLANKNIRLGGAFTPSSSYYNYGREDKNRKTVREVLDAQLDAQRHKEHQERLENQQAKEAA